MKAYARTRYHSDNQLPVKQVSQANRQGRVYLPAADPKEQERKTAKHGIDAEIEPETLVWVVLVVLCP